MIIFFSLLVWFTSDVAVADDDTDAVDFLQLVVTGPFSSVVQ